MIIAINIKSASLEENGFADNFVEETFRRIIPRHPEHNFVLISDGKHVDVFKEFKNVINVIKKPIKQSATQWYIWFNIKIPSILKKYKADIFVSYGSIASLRTKVPQCLIVPDLAFLHEPGLFKRKHILFLKTIVPRSLKKAKLVITVSEFCKADIMKQHKIKADKIAVVYRGIDENYKPLSIDKREIAKAKYANGNEYFIYAGEIGIRKNLQNLLRAFSAFKKRQKSSMQLLIAGPAGIKYEEFTKTLSLFRFKDDVKVLENISSEELEKVTASSYCFIYPSIYETFATPQLQAMKCLVPVITSSVAAMPEICDTAALYTDPDSFKDIAIKIMMVFKDENLRKSLIEKGKARAHKHNWEITSGLLWQSLEKILN
jgi:glycosyltransferase involved in cell wall biosynthesis